MPTEYTEAKEVQAVAAEVIRAHHRHLIGERIEYVFRSKHAKKAGKVVLGTARLVQGLNAFLAAPTDEEQDVFSGDAGETFFVMEIAKDTWKELDEKQRVALVDHELCHMWVEDEVDDDGNEKRVFKILAHDVEEFTPIINRHGLWKPDLEAFGTVAANKLQASLDIEIPKMVKSKPAAPTTASSPAPA